ncbi:UNVERIFIED_ORG: multisubunit Na+/H+ antiporter MnhE subunit [Xanthomonas campestris]
MSRCRRNALLALCLGAGLLAVSALGRWQLLPLSAHLAGLCAGAGVSCLVLSLLLLLSRGSLRDSTRPALARRYYREFGVPMGLYVVVMLFWRYLLAHVDPSWARVLIALLPAVLVALVIRAVARYVRDSDEMQRRIELESIAIAAGLVSGAYMTGGFLQAAELIDIPAMVAMLWVFPMLCAIYGVTKSINARRFE